jgi:hypothetical protein
MNRRTYIGMVGASVLPISIGATLHEQDERTIVNFENEVPQSIQGRSLKDVWVDNENEYSIAVYESVNKAIQIQFFPENTPRFVVMLHSANYESDELRDAVSMTAKFIRRVDVEYTNGDEGFACIHEFTDGTVLKVGYGEWEQYDVVVNGRVMEFDEPSERNRYVSNYVISKIK